MDKKNTAKVEELRQMYRDDERFKTPIAVTIVSSGSDLNEDSYKEILDAIFNSDLSKPSQTVSVLGKYSLSICNIYSPQDCTKWRFEKVYTN